MKQAGALMNNINQLIYCFRDPHERCCIGGKIINHYNIVVRRIVEIFQKSGEFVHQCAAAEREGVREAIKFMHAHGPAILILCAVKLPMVNAGSFRS